MTNVIIAFSHAAFLLSSRLCVQQLRFVPPWLTSRQTDVHTHTHRQHFDEVI